MALERGGQKFVRNQQLRFRDFFADSTLSLTLSLFLPLSLGRRRRVLVLFCLFVCHVLCSVPSAWPSFTCFTVVAFFLYIIVFRSLLLEEGRLVRAGT